MLPVDGFTYPLRERYKQRDSIVVDTLQVGDYHRTNWILAEYKLLNKHPSVHEGDDVVGYKFNCYGHDVLSIANGVCIHSETVPTGTWYNLITLEHTFFNGFKIYSRYAHLKDRLIQTGDEVKKGDLIGHIGGPERGMAPHLHFAICVTDLLVRDPRNWPSTGRTVLQAKSFILQNYIDPLFYIDSQIAMQPVPPIEQPPDPPPPEKEHDVTSFDLWVKNPNTQYNGVNFRYTYNTTVAGVAIPEKVYLQNGTKVRAYDLTHRTPDGKTWRLVSDGVDEGWMRADMLSDKPPA